jgi:hypothetical protein
LAVVHCFTNSETITSVSDPYSFGTPRVAIQRGASIIAWIVIFSVYGAHTTQKSRY